MDWKTLLFRLLLLLVAVAGGMLLLALTFYGLMFLNLLPAEMNGQGFGYALLYRCSFVIIGATVAGFAAIFIRPDWRNALLFAPLYAPTLFAIAFTLANQAPAAAP